MRVFASVRHAINSRYYYGGLWSGNFYPALEQLGHEIVESQVDLLPASRFMHIPGNFTPEEQAVQKRITERIIEEVRCAHREKPIDLFLSYFYNAHFDPAGFAEIRHLGIPTINFYCNSIYQFELVRDVSAGADFAWHPEKHARDLYLAAGARPVRVQMAADPAVYHPEDGFERKAAACFVGQRYADRDRWLAALVRERIPVEVYGTGWGHESERAPGRGENAQEAARGQYLGRPDIRPASVASYALVVRDTLKKEGLWRGFRRSIRQYRHKLETEHLAPLLASASRGRADALSTTFARYEVVLNFSNVWADGRPGSTLIPHVRLRDFEAPMCRTCYLTGYTDEIAEFYEPGTEIDTYRTTEELVDKTRFYLAHPDAAERLREAGYRRARRDHTWVNRFQQLFKETGVAS